MFHNLFKEVFMQMALPPAADLGSTISPATYIDMSQYDRGAFVLLVGATDRTTQTIQLLQATSSAGAGSKNVTNVINTTLGATDDNKYAIIEFGADQLDLAGGFRYVAVQPAVAGGTAAAAAVLFFGWRARTDSVGAPPSSQQFEYKIF